MLVCYSITVFPFGQIGGYLNLHSQVLYSSQWFHEEPLAFIELKVFYSEKKDPWIHKMLTG